MTALRDYEFQIVISAESRLEATKQFIKLRDSLQEAGWRVTDRDA